jgi:hypothetical protein
MYKYVTVHVYMNVSAYGCACCMYTYIRVQYNILNNKCLKPTTNIAF